MNSGGEEEFLEAAENFQCVQAAQVRLLRNKEMEKERKRSKERRR